MLAKARPQRGREIATSWAVGWMGRVQEKSSTGMEAITICKDIGYAINGQENVKLHLTIPVFPEVLPWENASAFLEQEYDLICGKILSKFAQSRINFSRWPGDASKNIDIKVISSPFFHGPGRLPNRARLFCQGLG
jgi:hypothetical protein